MELSALLLSVPVLYARMFEGLWEEGFKCIVDLTRSQHIFNKKT